MKYEPRTTPAQRELVAAASNHYGGRLTAAESIAVAGVLVDLTACEAALAEVTAERDEARAERDGARRLLEILKPVAPERKDSQ